MSLCSESFSSLYDAYLDCVQNGFVSIVICKFETLALKQQKLSKYQNYQITSRKLNSLRLRTILKRKSITSATKSLEIILN